MSEYLHCFDMTNKLKCMNIASTGALHSLLVVQLVTLDPRPHPSQIEIEAFDHYSDMDINGPSSARLFYIIRRSILRTLDIELTTEETRHLEIGNLEIQFERARRIWKPTAPSRLSCLFLVENNDDGRATLGSMFSSSFNQPKTIEVDTLPGIREIMRFDSRWVDEYLANPSEQALRDYWEQEPFNPMIPSWEYLLEGSIICTNNFQRQEVAEYVRINHPED